MATSASPLSFANAVVAAAGTSVAPSSPIPDNCIAVAILNISATQDALVGIAAPGAALVEGTNAARILAGTSLTLPLGALGSRGVMDESQLTASGLVYDGTGALTVDIIYQNALGTVRF
jgi:hypothetical protein